MIRLTRMGWLMLLMSGLLYGASMTSLSSLLLCLIGILLGCLVVNAAGAIRSIRGIEVIAPKDYRAVEGEAARPVWRLRNTRRQSAWLLQGLTEGGEILFRADCVPGETDRAVASSVTFRRRGVYSHAGLRIASTYPFGLLEVRRRLSLRSRHIVHPALYEAEAPPAESYEAMVGGKAKGRRRSPTGSEFAGARPFEPGDPINRIHWKASSRGQGLMVKLFDEELTGRVSFVVDPGRRDELDRADACARAAGSLMFASLEAGRHVEWVDLFELRVRQAPAFADGADTLDELAALTAGDVSWSAERVAEAARKCASRASLCVVLTGWSEELDEWARAETRKGRRLSVYVPIDAPAVAAEGARVGRYASGRIEREE